MTLLSVGHYVSPMSSPPKAEAVDDGCTVLAGRTIAITRAVDQAGPLKERLEALGAAVVEVPVIAIAEPADGGDGLRAAINDLHTYDWVVLTSPNAAARFFGALTGQGQGQGVGPNVAVVGPGTGDVVQRAGGVVHFVPNRSVGEGIVETFPSVASATKGGRVLLPQAAAARPTVADGLRNAGWSVDVVEAYRTVAAVPDEGRVAAALAADAVVFTSSSTAQRFADIADIADIADRTDKADRTRSADIAGSVGWPLIISMGPQTTLTVESLGRTVAATADPHTLDGLLSVIVRLLTMSA